MTTWLCTNTILTAFALAFMRLNAKSPHRLRFLVCFIALCSWTIPWNQVSGLLPAPAFMQQYLAGIAAFDAGSASQLSAGSSAEIGIAAIVLANVGLILLAAAAFGVLLFLNAIRHHKQLICTMMRQSVSANELWRTARLETDGVTESGGIPELRMQQEVSGALTTGIFSPIIWVHADLAEHQDLGAVLIHEYQHVRNRDNIYLWVMTLIEQLFWWNPLVRYLSSQARRLQELSCDEACAKEIPGYRHMLLRLVLALSNRPTRQCLRAPCIHHSNNFNVQRLSILKEQYVMKTRHYMGISILLLGSTLVLGCDMAQNGPKQSARIDCSPTWMSTLEELIEFLGKCKGENLKRPSDAESIATSIEEARRLFRGHGAVIPSRGAILSRSRFEKREADGSVGSLTALGHD